MIYKKNTICALLFFIPIYFVINLSPVFATEKCEMPPSATAEPQIDWPTSPLTSKTIDRDTTIPKLIEYFFEWGVGLGGLAVFIALVIAGVEYVTSIANPNKTKDAKERIKSSLIGLVLLLSSWAIFKLINPSLNTLEDLPDFTGNILRGGIATDTPCSFNWDCCKIIGCNPSTDCPDPNAPSCCMNESCAPENFVCCSKNDSQCIRNKKPNPISGPSTKKPSGTTSNCRNDNQCQSNYCHCDKSSTPWTQYCKDDPSVCIEIIGEATLGCDYIALYDAPDHQGTPQYYEVLGSNSGWVAPTGRPIKSYQTVQAAKNQKGEYIDDSGNVVASKDAAKKVFCGRNACGCELNICADPSPTAYSCVNIEELGAAFNANVDGDRLYIEIKDETKGTWVKAKKSLGNFWSWLTGT